MTICVSEPVTIANSRDHLCDLCALCRFSAFLQDLSIQTFGGRRCFDVCYNAGYKEQFKNSHLVALWKLLEVLIEFQHRVGKIWKTDCQRQVCRAMWRQQLCARPPAAPTNDHEATASDAASAPDAKIEPIKDMGGDEIQQLLNFFDLYPRLKRSLGGLIVRFYDPRALSSGPIAVLKLIMQRFRLKIVSLGMGSDDQKEAVCLWSMLNALNSTSQALDNSEPELLEFVVMQASWKSRHLPSVIKACMPT